MNATIKNILPKSTRNDVRNLQLHWNRLMNKLYKDAVHGPGLKKLRTTDLPLKINFGCGPLAHPGWVNVDYIKSENTYYYDLRDKLPLKGGIASNIHCEHFMEHLTQEDAIQFMKECFRLLQPGGLFRIIVPDAEKYIKAYAKNDDDYFSHLSKLGNAAHPFRTKIEIINQMFRMGGDHLFAWDFETMSLYLKEAGFSKVKRSGFREIPANICIDGQDEWRTHESLYVVAYK
ncbi:MAG: hypothetical protein R2830_02930 [Saprospiraceae bacterium]